MTKRARAVPALKQLVRAWALGLALLPAWPGSSHAVPQIVGSFYEEWKQAFCQNTTTCTLTMSPVPAGKYLVVTNLNCVIGNTGSGSTIQSATLIGFGGLNTPLRPQFFTISGQFKRHIIDAQLNKVFRSGGAPRIYVHFATTRVNSSIGCSIMGELH